MLSLEDVDKIAALARLELSDELRTRMRKDLSSVLEFVAQLERVDTSAVEPLYQVTGLQNALREDGGERPWPLSERLTELLVGQAPHRRDRYVQVKSIKAK